MSDATPRCGGTGLPTIGAPWRCCGALDARNKMSHTYNARVFEQVVGEIADRYLVVMEDLNRLLTTKEADDG